MTSLTQKGASSSKIFKWRWREEPSISTRLINEVPLEIELSDYHRLEASGSESPSELLNGEGLKTELISDLDLFFERLYIYCCEKGLWCIIIKWIVEMLTAIFLIFFIGFFLLVVDWPALYNAKCGIDAFEARNKTCNLADEVINHHPLVPFTFSKGVVLGSMVMVTIYGLFNFLKFIVQFRNTVKVRNFYYNSLNVTDRDIQTTAWPVILDKVVQLQSLQQLCVVKDLSAHDVVMRIMRKENYLIGMLNKGVLAFPLPWWVPGVGPVVSSKMDGIKNRLMFTKTLEWALNWCIFQSMFDNNFLVRRDFIANPAQLRKRLMIVGLCIFLFSPCLVIFMMVYLFLRHAEQFYHHPSIASSRRWSNLSKWILRDFNEVEHLFKHRISNSTVHASNYLKQFPAPIVSILAKFVSFVAGGFAAILIMIAFLDESLLEGHLFGRNLFWYAAVFGSVTAISRAAISDDLQVHDPQGEMSFVVQHTHYMPKRWRGKENYDCVRREFVTLFQYTGMLLLEEMASIFITPILLIFVVPKRADDILHFISDFTVYVEGVGNVCSFSLFDFESHGNKKYGSPYDAPKDRKSSQGKMEKSFLSFQSSYPTWEPGAHGQQFLSNLRNFREKQMRWAEGRPDLPPHPEWQQFALGSNIQGTTLRMSPMRGSYYNVRTSPPRHFRRHQLLLNPDHRSQPYLLDWYYVWQSLHGEDSFQASPPPRPGIVENKRFENVWASEEKKKQTEAQEDEEEETDKWAPPGFFDREQSHLEASTSVPFFFKDSVLERRNRDSLGPGSTGHWWNRSGGPKSSQADPEASFVDPPAYGHHDFSHHSDDLWYGGVDEPVESAGGLGGDSGEQWGSLSKTQYMEDSVKYQGFHPPFVDNPPPRLRSLPVRILPRSNDPL